VPETKKFYWNFKRVEAHIMKPNVTSKEIYIHWHDISWAQFVTPEKQERKVVNAMGGG